MNGRHHVFARRAHALGVFRVLGILAAATTFLSCKDPTPINTAKIGTGGASGSGGSGTSSVPGSFNEDCPAGDDWLPPDGGPTPPVPMFNPAPHPDTECPFYRGAFQTFLIATAPTANGDPALVEYPTIADAFTSAYNTKHPRNTGDPLADPYANPGGAAAAAAVRAGPATGKAWLGAVHQAGQRQLLIDRYGHTLYYGLHMNQAFVDFVKTNMLQTQDGIVSSVKNDPNLQFPPGVAEFKTAWQDIDPRDFPDANGNLGTPNGKVPSPTDFDAGEPGNYSNYITTMAWIPWLSQDPQSKHIVEDPEHPVQRKMALIAIHCVYTLPGHPEFIWGSVQHVNLAQVDPAPLAFAGISILGMPDTQPNATGPDGGAVLVDPNNASTNPAVVTQSPDMAHDYLLFNKATPESASNGPLEDPVLALDEAKQRFTNPPMNIFRVFPGSKSTTLQPDTAVFSLNSNINTMFQKAIDAGSMNPNVDKRQNYRLVAAVWLDKPELFGLGPKQAGMSLQNDDPAQPLVVAAQMGNPMASVSQGASCGTPRGPNPLSGDDPNATSLNNTVPGCVTRYDDLDLPDAASPQFEDDGGPIDPFDDFRNAKQGTDSPFSILGGEDRLSSTSMETFTQNNTFHNCFTCHNTQPISANGTSQTPDCVALPGAPTVPNCPATTIPYPAKINVSHMFSEFILEEQEAALRHPDGGAN